MRRIPILSFAPVRLLLAGAMGLAAAGCDGDSPSGSKTPAAIVAVSATSQKAPVGTAVPDPPRVKVTDQNGNPLAGATVAWTAVGGGTVSPTTSTTDAQGIATTAWTLGPTVNTLQSAEARVGTLNAVAFTANGTAGPISPQKVSGDNQTAQITTPLPQPLVVKVALANGTPVSGAGVYWVPVVDASHTGTTNISPNGVQTITDVNGMTSLNVGLGTKSGAVLVRAIVASDYTQPPTAADSARGVSFNATATPLPAQYIKQSGTVPSPIAVGTTVPVSVIVTDFYDNPLPGQQVTFTVVDGSSTVAPTTVTTGANGVATAQWTMNAPGGRQTVEMRTGNLTPARVTTQSLGAFNVNIGFPIHDDPVIGDNLQLRVQPAGNDTANVVSVVAEVAGRQVTLTKNSSNLFGVYNVFYEGNLDLTGLPNGYQFVTFTFNMVGGGTYTTKRRFIHQSP